MYFFSTGYIFLNKLCAVWKCVKSYAYKYTQFCIAGLHESSPEEPKMHQNSWRPGLHPGPHWGSLQHSPRLPSRWERAFCLFPKNLNPGSVFELRPFEPCLAPAMLISFRRHCSSIAQRFVLETHVTFRLVKQKMKRK